MRHPESPLSIESINEVIARCVSAIPCDHAVVRPPRQLRPRLRQYAVALPQFGSEEFSWGYDQISQYPAMLVLVLFSDVAADYSISKCVIPSIAMELERFVGTACTETASFMLLRKEVAVWAGLGTIGRNGLFFSRRFGFNCKIDLLLLSLEVKESLDADITPRNAFLAPCHTCNICVDACPVSAYDDYSMLKPHACEKHIAPDWYYPERMCRSCITSCPYSETLLSRVHHNGAPKYLAQEISDADSQTYVCCPGLSLERRGMQLIIGGAVEVTVDSEFAGLIEWILDQGVTFSKCGLFAQFPWIPPPDLEQLFHDLRAAGIIRAHS